MLVGIPFPASAQHSPASPLRRDAVPHRMLTVLVESTTAADVCTAILFQAPARAPAAKHARPSPRSLFHIREDARRVQHGESLGRAPECVEHDSLFPNKATEEGQSLIYREGGIEFLLVPQHAGYARPAEPLAPRAVVTAIVRVEGKARFKLVSGLLCKSV